MQLPLRSDRIFRALADPTRRDILDALVERPLPVHEIAARFEISRPAVSKHLRVLGSAGLVHAMRAGKENIYELDQRPLQEVLDWLGRFWAGRLNTLKSLAERKN